MGAVLLKTMNAGMLIVGEADTILTIEPSSIETVRAFHCRW
jgi:hypothetical protein